MALDLGLPSGFFSFDTGLPSSSGLDFSFPSSDFQLPSVSLPTELSVPSFSVAPDLFSGGSPSGSWWGNMKDIGNAFLPFAQLGTTGLQGYSTITSMANNARYQRQLQDYYATQKQQQADYNKAVEDYLASRKAWEQSLMDQTMGAESSFADAMRGFQDQMSQVMGQAKDIFNQHVQAALPELQQGAALTRTAVAALAKGEVPAEWQPIFAQARQRARAAAMQQLASAGADESTATAAIEPQLDEAQNSLLMSLANNMLGQGMGLTGQGLTALGGAAGVVGTEGNLATAAISPIEREFLSMLQAVGGLTGGFPSLAPATTPPPPVA